MELTQLKYFATVARNEHMTKAAQELNISQPALSHAISNLEKELGVQLFSRTGRSLALTPYGLSFYQNVKAIFEELGKAEKNRRELEHAADRLYVATNCSASFSSFFLPFLEKKPLTRLQLIYAEPEQMDGLLRRGQIDLAFGLLQQDQASPDVRILEDRLYAAVHADMLRPDCQTLSLEDISNIAKVYSLSEPEITRWTDEIFQKRHHADSHSVVTDCTNSALRLVAMGYGVHISTGCTLYSTLQTCTAEPVVLSKLIRIQPISDPDCVLRYGLAVRKADIRSTLADEAAEYIIQNWSDENLRNPESLLIPSELLQTFRGLPDRSLHSINREYGRAQA